MKTEMKNETREKEITNMQMNVSMLPVILPSNLIPAKTIEQIKM
jgi:hypothetical protein